MIIEFGRHLGMHLGIVGAGLLLAVAVLVFSLPASASADSLTPSPVAAGAQLEKIQSGFAFTEGPACDAHGNVFFTDQPNDKIWQWHAADGKLTEFMHPCGRSNGMSFDAHGDLWACADEKNALWRITPSGKETVVIAEYQGKLLNGPNDVWIRPDGGLYLTDPLYARDYWKRSPVAQQDTEGVYYLPPGGKVLTRVVADMTQPNGIIGTPDGKTLYVADIGAGKTYAYQISPDGSLTNKHLFCALGSDGMTLDSEGNLYLTGSGVTVFNKLGVQIAQIPVPEGWTGNVCFAGTDRRTLFITASTSIYKLAMRTHGVGSQ